MIAPYANALGGLILGWVSCKRVRSPIYDLLGSGVAVMAVALAKALAGA